MNDLELYFQSNTGRLIHKWVHYFEIYDRHFSRFRNTEACIVEIGVFHGGSLQMWRNYFGTQAKIIGIDIDPRCKQFEEEGIEIVIGDQADRNFLASIRERLPKIDILIDDGGHTMPQQITTFEELFSCISERGIYLCEDLHTSYWREYGGGFRHSGSFIEYSKTLIDLLNAWHSQDPEVFQVSDFTRSAHSLHFYDSILVIEKRSITPPCVYATGTPSFQDANVVHLPMLDQVSTEEKSRIFSDYEPSLSSLSKAQEQPDLAKQLRKMEKKIQRIQTKLQQVKQERNQAIDQVIAMKNSKVWKLKSWLSSLIK